MKALRLVLVWLALALIAGLGWRVLHPAVQGVPAFARLRPVQAPVTTPPKAPPPAAVPQTGLDAAAARSLVLSRLADAPDYAPFFDRLRSAFPAEYLATIDAAVAATTKNGRAPNPDRLMIDALRGLRQTRGILAAQAEDQPLASVFVAQAALLDALAAHDPELCVDVLYGGMSPSFMAFAATHRDVVARVANASLSAILSGQANHVERAQPKPDDFDALTAALKDKGLSGDEIAAVLDGKTFDPPIPEPRLCAAGQTYLRALQDLPEDARFRVYALSAALLARS